MKTFPHKLLFAILIGAVVILSGHVAYAAVLNVPDQFATIQEAVNAASEGDSINVADGSYAGAIVRKSLDIEGSGAIIDGSLSRLPIGFLLLGAGAAGSTISHFTFKNVSFGIMINGVNDVTISHNVMGDEMLAQGITISALQNVGSKRTLISHNVINDFQLASQGYGALGIAVYLSENVMLKHNKIITQDKARRTTDGYIYGFIVLLSKDTMISQNDVHMAHGEVLTNAVNIDSESTGTIVSFNDFRGTSYDFIDKANDPNFGPSVNTTVQRNFSDGPEMAADNRGEGHTDIRPSELIPHGNVVVEFTE